MLNFRIFWKSLSKMAPESHYLCGFQKPTVEIGNKPDRALTRNFPWNDRSIAFNTENYGLSPLGH